MPNRKRQVKQETRVSKIVCSNTDGLLKETELTGRGSSKDMRNTSLVSLPSVGQSRRDSTLKKSARKSSLNSKGNFATYVPVVGKTGKPLMPCLPVRARELMQKGKAIGKWKVGIFYIQLLDREDGVVQDIAGVTWSEPAKPPPFSATCIPPLSW